MKAVHLQQSVADKEYYLSFCLTASRWSFENLLLAANIPNVQSQQLQFNYRTALVGCLQGNLLLRQQMKILTIPTVRGEVAVHEGDQMDGQRNKKRERGKEGGRKGGMEGERKRERKCFKKYSFKRISHRIMFLLGMTGIWLLNTDSHDFLSACHGATAWFVPNGHTGLTHLSLFLAPFQPPKHVSHSPSGPDSTTGLNIFNTCLYHCWYLRMPSHHRTLMSQ